MGDPSVNPGVGLLLGLIESALGEHRETHGIESFGQVEGENAIGVELADGQEFFIEVQVA